MIFLRKLHLIIDYVWLRVFSNPVVSWSFAGFIYYLIDNGIEGSFILFGANVTYEDFFILLMLGVILSPIILPYSLRKHFPNGLRHRLRQLKKPMLAQQKTDPVKVIVPTQQTDGITEIVSRLPPHLKRIIAGEG